MSTASRALPSEQQDLERLGGVVGDGEGKQLEVADGDDFVVAREAKAGRRHGLADGAPGAAAHPQRQAVALGQRHRAADVVAVLVGHEDGVEVGGGEAGAGQPGLELAQREAGVDEEPRRRDAAGRLDDGGVAAAAAAEAAEADHASRGRSLQVVEEQADDALAGVAAFRLALRIEDGDGAARALRR